MWFDELLQGAAQAQAALPAAWQERVEPLSLWVRMGRLGSMGPV
jgi:hypothetical protein